MMYLYPHNSFQALGEHRLIGRNLDAMPVRPEVQAIADAVTNETLPEEEVMNALKKLSERADLQEQERILVNKNLESLVQRASINNRAKLKEEAEKTRKSLEQKNQLPATKVTSQVQAPTEEKTFMEKTKEATKKSWDWTKEQLDVSKWSNEKKAAVATATVGLVSLGILVYWLRNRNKNKNQVAENKPRSKWGWLKWLPIIGVVGVGGYLLHKNLKGFAPYKKFADDMSKRVADFEKKYIDNSAKAFDVAVVGTTVVGAGIAGAGGEILKVGTPLAETGINAAKTVGYGAYALVEKLRNGENADEAMKGFMESGGAFLESGGKFFAVYGTEMVEIPQKWFSTLHGALNGKNSWGEFAYVYGSAGGLYVLHKAGANLLTGRIARPTIAKILGDVALHPVYVIKNGVKTSLGLMCLVNNREVVLTKIGGWSRWLQFREALSNTKQFGKNGSFNALLKASTYWKDSGDVMAIMEANKDAWTKGIFSFDDVDIGRLLKQRTELAREIQKALKQLDQLPSDAPEWFKRLYSARNFEHGEFSKILGTTVSDEALHVATRGTEDVSKMATKTTTHPTPKTEGPEPLRKAVGDGVVEPTPAKAIKPVDIPDDTGLKVVRSDGTTINPKTGEVIDDAKAVTTVEKSLAVSQGPGLEKLLAKIGKQGAQAKDVEAFLQLAHEAKLIELDADTVAMIAKSKSAQKIIAGAIETTELTEVTRALDIAKKGAQMRKTIGSTAGIGLNTVGIAGDALGIYMAYADWQMNKGRIDMAKTTQNKELQALYEKANYVYLAEGGQSAAGLVIGGYAIVSTLVAGKGVVAAFSASGGLIMLPAAFAALGGRYVYNKAEAATEFWTKNANDWANSAEGELYEKLIQAAPGGTGIEGQGYATGTTAEQLWRLMDGTHAEWQEKGFQTAESANQGSRGKLVRALFMRLTNLPVKLVKGSDGNFRPESKEEYTKRRDEFINIQTEYMRISTHGGFNVESVNGEFTRARGFAELSMYASELRATNASDIIELEVQEVKPGTSEFITVKKQFDLAKVNTLKWHTGGELGISMNAVLGAFMHRQTEQKVTTFNCMKIALEGNADQRTHTVNNIRKSLLADINFDVAKLDGKIRLADLTGWNWSGGEENSRNLVRYYIFDQINRLIAQESDRLFALSNGVNAKEYSNSISNIQAELLHMSPEQLEVQTRAYFNGRVPTNTDSGSHLISAAHLSENITLVNDEKDEEAKNAGLALFADKTEVNGILTRRASRGSELYYKYVPKAGWQWSPDRVNWMSVNTVVVKGGKYDGQAPVDENMDFIKKLNGKSVDALQKANQAAEEYNRWKQIVEKRFAEGRTTLTQHGAVEQANSNGQAFYYRTGRFMKPHAFYFNQEKGQWFMSTNLAWRANHHQRLKDALEASKDPSQLSWDEAGLENITRAIQGINELQ